MSSIPTIGIIREALEIKFHPYNRDREDGFVMSRSWKHLIHFLI